MRAGADDGAARGRGSDQALRRRRRRRRLHASRSRRARSPALIGPNGSGKTTAFNLDHGLPAGRRGNRQVRRSPRPAAGPHAALAGDGLARTFQQRARVPGADGAGEPRGCRQRPWRALLRRRRCGRRQRARADELIEEFGLTRSPTTAPARALVRSAQVARVCVSADGPSRGSCCSTSRPAGVNPVMIEKIESHVRSTCNARGLTFLIVEHDMHLVMRISEQRDRARPQGPRSRRASRRGATRSAGRRRLPRGRVTAISIRGLVAGYGQGDILRGVDLEVESGTIGA